MFTIEKKNINNKFTKIFVAFDSSCNWNVCD